MHLRNAKLLLAGALWGALLTKVGAFPDPSGNRWNSAPNVAALEIEVPDTFNAENTPTHYVTKQIPPGVGHVTLRFNGRSMAFAIDRRARKLVPVGAATAARIATPDGLAAQERFWTEYYAHGLRPPVPANDEIHRPEWQRNRITGQNSARQAELAAAMEAWDWNRNKPVESPTPQKKS